MKDQMLFPKCGTGYASARTARVVSFLKVPWIV
jgi:hypothetical protein